MRPQFSGSALFKNRKFAIAVLALFAILLVGLISVAGVALYNKAKNRPAPEILPTATATARATSTRPPTATVLPAAQPSATRVILASPTPKPAATTQPAPSPTATAPAPTPAPTATPVGTGDVPNTGAPTLPILLAGGSLAGVLLLARSGRRRAR